MSPLSVRRAFTLIELLVVIAIIAILAAILFPVFAQAKESAKQAACILHIRQMGMAHMMYRSDYDDVWVPAGTDQHDAGFPPQKMWIGYDNANDLGAVNGWIGNVTEPATGPVHPGMIDPYLKSEGIKRCPSQPGNWQLAIAYNWFYVGFPSPFYARFPQADGQEFGPGGKLVTTSANGGLISLGASESEIEEPANTLASWEHKAGAPVCNFLQGADWLETPPNDPVYSNHFHFLHRNGGTGLWADGHVKRIVYGALKRRYFSCRKDIYQ